MKNHEKKGVYLVLMTAFISGLSIFINKFGVSNINPYLFTGLKNAFVAILLSALLIGFKQRKLLLKLPLKTWLMLITIGLIGGSIPFLLFFKGLSLTSAAQASLIHKNMFLIVALFSPLLLKEKLQKYFFMSAILIIFGNLLLLTKAFPLTWNIGNSLILTATVLWAGENILSRKMLKSLPSILVAWGRMFFGSVIIFGYLLFTHQLSGIMMLSENQWPWIIITSLFLFGYVFTWYAGLKYLKVTTATALLTLGAPLTTLLTLLTAGKLALVEILGIIAFLIATLILLEAKTLAELIRKSLPYYHERS